MRRPDKRNWKKESTDIINKMDAWLIHILQYSQSSSVVKLVCAGGPEPRSLLATTEQEWEVSGENPATVSGSDWEGE